MIIKEAREDPIDWIPTLSGKQDRGPVSFVTLHQWTDSFTVKKIQNSKNVF